MLAELSQREALLALALLSNPKTLACQARHPGLQTLSQRLRAVCPEQLESMRAALLRSFDEATPRAMPIHPERARAALRHFPPALGERLLPWLEFGARAPLSALERPFRDFARQALHHFPHGPRHLSWPQPRAHVGYVALLGDDALEDYLDALGVDALALASSAFSLRERSLLAARLSQVFERVGPRKRLADFVSPSEGDSDEELLRRALSLELLRFEQQQPSALLDKARKLGLVLLCWGAAREHQAEVDFLRCRTTWDRARFIERQLARPCQTGLSQGARRCCERALQRLVDTPS